MANRTVSDAIAVHGTNPQYLIEKIIRTRIYESLYWKEFCFGLTAETLIDKAIELTSFGGEYGNQRPTEFLCLTLKLLQLQPSKEIVLEFIRNEDYKYLRALGAFYLRLVGNSLEIYQTLEPLLNDYRKLRKRTNDGDFEIVCMDEFIDELLREERACDTILPRILKRYVLEENGELEPRESIEKSSDNESATESPKENNKNRNRGKSSRRNRSYSRSRTSPSRRYSRSRSRSPKRRGGDWRADRYVPSDNRGNRRRRRISYSRSRSRSRSRSYDRYEPSYRRGKSFSSSSYRPSRHRSYTRSLSRDK
ncbi:8790_t:CDS:2 [Funneliformis caledonium]|uniref:Pre-mRNA-splicing factor 38 n=1 Tax=Funneliformis caledonium TaxID=1117310 RepID=A0A9N9BJI5_9GLOM|nr:8790_t:CDS:2 [Funneliformis caledonium]